MFIDNMTNRAFNHFYYNYRIKACNLSVIRHESKSRSGFRFKNLLSCQNVFFSFNLYESDLKY